ncbi:MAG: penicillin acylase family protein [Bacteroidota bacterium]|nr:penicillin acylase family protein [Bacteroidota bacterium]
MAPAIGGPLRRWLWGLFFALIGFAAFAGLVVWFLVYRPLPEYRGQIRLDGLSRPVLIQWDSSRVPHIYAETEEDLFFALGYVHAYERRWQMTLLQLATEGRFAEFFGPELVPLDRLLRTIGIWQMAQALWRELTPQERARLEAYSAGVNAASRRRPRPVEHALVGFDPLPWSPLHSLGLVRLMAWELNFAWRIETTLGVLAERLDSARFRALWPIPYPEQQVAPSRISKTLQALQRVHELLADWFGSPSAAGSNAWVVSGLRTRSGKPLLANDPHLMLQVPPRWYEVALHGPGWRLVGATLPGGPAVVLGHNERIAWGVTNAMLDDCDFYLEAVDPRRPGWYVLSAERTDSAGRPAGAITYARFQTRTERIRIKGRPDSLIVIRYTERGPVVTDLLPDSAQIRDRLIAMRWTGLERSHELRALWGVNRARNWGEFQEALRDFGVPAQNFVYADVTGRIGYLLAGRIPIRQGGRPQPLARGWETRGRWIGYVPFEAQPQLFDPPSGFIATANNPPAPPDYPYYLSELWEPSARIERIRELLENRTDLTVADMMRAQTDLLSPFARRLVPYILRAFEGQGSPSGPVREALAYLRAWDYGYGPESIAASIFESWFLAFCRLLFAEAMGPSYAHWLFIALAPVRTVEALIAQPESPWYDDPRTAEIEGRELRIRQALEEAVRDLSARLGPESHNWRWEHLHTLTLEPPLLGEAARRPNAHGLLRLLVRGLFCLGPYGAAGSYTTIPQAQYWLTEPYAMRVGASIRRIVDLADPTSSYSSLPGGQSGHPVSRHYGDQLADWLAGRYKRLLWDSTGARIRGPSLRLEPLR